METKANYVLIGFFTLGVLAAGFAFVHWFRSIGRATVSASYHVIFQGPVGGLRTGATVQFNGMRVGEVSGLELNREDPKQVVATIKVDANTPVRSDTTVGLDFQGLTGIAAIGLKGGDPTAGPLPEGPDGLPTLVAEISATQDITASAREVLRKLDAFISDNSGTVHTSLQNLESFTATLKSNSERIDRILATVDKSMAGVQLLTGSGDDKNPGQISETLKSFKTLADDVDQKTLKHVDSLILTARSALQTFDRAVTNFDRNPSRVIFGGGSPATAPAAPAAGTGTRRAQ
jgi:phospholipid/cholesterol/gamma-HCH transport system substrate-binding protein